MPIINKNEVTICYEAYGVPTNPCIILVTGVAAQLVFWPNEILQGLADAGFYVVCFDNRDVGLSSYYDHLETPTLAVAGKALSEGKPFRPPYTINDMASDIVILLDTLNVAKAHIIGISMGGYIAQALCLDHGDRVLSLTLIATSSSDIDLPPPAPEVMAFFANQDSSGSNIESAIDSHVKQYKIYNYPDDFNKDEVLKLHEKAYARAYHPQGNKRQVLAMICASPRGEQLREVEVPSLIIHGDYDPVMPIQHGIRLSECLSSSRLEIINNLGHGLPRRMHSTILELLVNHCKKA